MVIDKELVTEKQKEYCAVTVMRRMIEKYAKQNGISFEDMMYAFSESSVYEALFDFETDIWKEGPDYLIALYEEEIASKE